MRRLWVLTLGLAALAATQGCKRKEPEPIPGPKAVSVAVGHARAPGIAWFQGGLDEAFTTTATICSNDDRRSVAPVAPDVARMRNRVNSPPPPAACRTEPCPPITYLRRPLV
jgi:hypothetical protein